MELRQLRYFLRVADLKSFSRAAATVGIAQPALSRQIRKLEEELGADLFYRDGRGAILTDAGKQYCEKLRTLLRQLDQAGTEVMATKDVPAGEVLLGVPPQLGAVLIAQLIQRFRDRFPLARLRVSEAFSYQIAEWLSAGRIDVGFVYEPLEYRHLEKVLMVEEMLYVVSHPGDPLTAGCSVPFHTILELPLIVPDLPSTLRARVEDVAARRGAAPRYSIEVDSLPAIKRLVRDGAGYTILPHAAVSDEVTHGLLSAAPIVDPPVSRPLALAVPLKGALSLATRKLIDLIADQVRAFIADGTWSGRIVERIAAPADGVRRRGLEGQ
jgi:LysR family transcriptional regulator, nitrogen assimilation regulatory protein